MGTQYNSMTRYKLNQYKLGRPCILLLTVATHLMLTG